MSCANKIGILDPRGVDKHNRIYYNVEKLRRFTIEMKSKEDFDFPKLPTPAESQPDTKWFSFFQELSEKGGIKCGLEGGLKSAARDSELCKGRTAEGTIFHVWQTRTFFMLDMDRKQDSLVEAVSKILGRQPARYGADQKTKHYVAEWEKDDQKE